MFECMCTVVVPLTTLMARVDWCIGVSMKLHMGCQRQLVKEAWCSKKSNSQLAVVRTLTLCLSRSWRVASNSTAHTCQSQHRRLHGCVYMSVCVDMSVGARHSAVCHRQWVDESHTSSCVALQLL
jgi:hypothetical protein